MKRVIIVGSPRTAGRSAHLAEMLFEANIDERPEDELFLIPVSEIDVGPCIGCNACRKKIDVTYRDDSGDEVTEPRHRCVFDDDMQMVYDLLDDADALTIVCPVYFSGAPAPMKCLLDRLQPYFWKYTEDGPILPKRPMELHIVGEGGDPHGYGPLVSEVKAPTALAGFGLERILDWVGKTDAQGDIIAEAEEVVVPLPLPSGRPVGQVAASEVAGEVEPSGAVELPGVAKAAAGEVAAGEAVGTTAGEAAEVVKAAEWEPRDEEGFAHAAGARKLGHSQTRRGGDGPAGRPKLDLTGGKTGATASGKGGSAKGKGGAKQGRESSSGRGSGGGFGRSSSGGAGPDRGTHAGSGSGRGSGGGASRGTRNAADPDRRSRAGSGSGRGSQGGSNSGRGARNGPGSAHGSRGGSGSNRNPNRKGGRRG